MKRKKNLTEEVEEVQSSAEKAETKKRKLKKETAFLWAVGICVTLCVVVVGIVLFADPMAAMMQKKDAMKVFSDEEIRVVVGDPSSNGPVINVDPGELGGYTFGGIDGEGGITIGGQQEIIISKEEGDAHISSGDIAGGNSFFISGITDSGGAQLTVGAPEVILTEEQAGAILGEVEWMLKESRFEERDKTISGLWIPYVMVTSRENRAKIYLGNDRIFLEKDGIYTSYEIEEENMARYLSLYETVTGYVKALKEQGK